MATIIAAEQLSKSYKKKKLAENTVALDNLNLTIEEGEIFGFLGPNGAGKTTTIKLLLGFIHPDQGSVRIFGEPGGSVKVRQKLGFLPEVSYYYKFLKAGELLDAYGRIFHIPSNERKKRISMLLEKVGLSGKEKTYLRDFSKGMLQRFSLAQALLNEPRLLILDEPTSGLDPMGRREFREIILELHKQGVTIFFSSHELSAVELISTRVGILHKGKLVKEGKLQDLLPSNRSVQIRLIEPMTPEARTNLLDEFKKLNPPEVSSNLSIHNEDHQTILHLENRKYLYPLIHVVEKQNLSIETILQVRETLEDLFVRTVKD